MKHCPPSLPVFPYEDRAHRTACVDTSTDPDHCGDCGVHCAVDEACVAGACRPACDGVTCRSATVCGTTIPCETYLHGACVDAYPQFQGCVPSCATAANACGFLLVHGFTRETCQRSYDCTSCRSER